MLLVATDPRFAEHDPGRGHPERRPGCRRCSTGSTAAGLDDGGAGARARAGRRGPSSSGCTRGAVPRPARARSAPRGGGSLDRRHRGVGGVVGRRAPRRRSRPRGGRRARTRRRRRRVLRGAPARPPRRADRTRWASACSTTSRSPPRRCATAASGCSIVDWDAHHGNGTQDIFYADADVMYVSMHEWPLYPGTGRLDDIGAGAGRGHHGQLPAPGRRDRRRLPRRDRHGRRAARRAVRARPGCSSRPASTRTAPIRSPASGSRPATTPTSPPGSWRSAPARRLVVFLEGGYDLDALRDSVAATVSTLLGAPGPARAGHRGRPGPHRRPRGPGSARPPDGSRPTPESARSAHFPADSAPSGRASRADRRRVAESEAARDGRRRCWISISCCATPSSAARPTCTSRSARRRSSASTAASSGPITPTVSPVETERIAFAIMPKQRAEEFIAYAARPTSRTRCRASGASAST